MNRYLLKKLYMIPSLSGDEGRMRDFIKSYISRNIYGCEVTEDSTGNLYVRKGEADIYPAMCAHMDEVHYQKSRRIIFEGDLVYGKSRRGERIGIGADDKNGIYAILETLMDRPVMKALFTVGEEYGGVGAGKADLGFLSDCSIVMECDRRGNSDLITSIYETGICDDGTRDKLLGLGYGFKEEIGMFTDVYVLKRRGLNAPCVNVSAGYYRPHSDMECTVLNELDNTVKFAGAVMSLFTIKNEENEKREENN